MKRNTTLFLLITALFFVQSVQAQITINRKDYTINTIADTIFARTCLVAGVAVPQLGNNQTWDYTSLKDSAGGNSAAPFPFTKTPFAAPFQKANYYFDIITPLGPLLDISRYYYLIDSTGGATIGHERKKDNVVDVSAITGTLGDNVTIKADQVVFNPPYKAGYFTVFPITANSSAAYSISDTLNLRLNIAGFGLVNLPASAITKELDTVRTVGWGAIKVKGASGTTLSYQVLLQQLYTKQIDSFFTQGSPAPTALLTAFGLKQGNIRITNTFSFMGLGLNYPLLKMDVLADGKTVTRVSGVSTTKLLTDVKDFQTVASNVFPNPIRNAQTLNFNFDKQSQADWYITLFNAAGQSEAIFTVKGVAGATQYNAILSKNLVNGVHFYNIVDGNSLIRSSGKFVVVSE